MNTDSKNKKDNENPIFTWWDLFFLFGIVAYYFVVIAVLHLTPKK